MVVLPESFSSSTESLSAKLKVSDSDNYYEKCGQKKLQNADKILADIGGRNPYVLWLTFLLAWGWALAAMAILCSAFFVDEELLDDGSTSRRLINQSSSQTVEDAQQRSRIADYATSAFMFGNVFGASGLTYASDKVGRKPVVISSMLCIAITGFVPLVVNSLYVLSLGRFLQGICSPGLLLVDWVLAYECIPMSLRGYATLIFGVLWVIGYCAIAPIAYYIPDWKWLTIACTTPSGIAALAFVFIIPESLHYLVVKNKEKKVRRWVEKAKLYSSKKESWFTTDIMYEKLVPCEEKPAVAKGKAKVRISLLEEMKANKMLIMYLIILTFLWTSDTFVYFGLSLYTTKLAGNMYWNYILSGLVELPAYILSPPALERIGRKPVVAITHFIAGISLTGLILIPEGMTWLTTSFCMMGKFAISCSFMSIMVYSNEIFPTTIRSGSVGLCSVVARMGGILAPYVRLLSSVATLLPMLIFGALSIIAGLLTLLLPETKNQALPSLVRDVNAEKTLIR